MLNQKGTTEDAGKFFIEAQQGIVTCLNLKQSGK
jgi:hypothetical protein